MKKISLNQFARERGVNPGTIYRKCKELSISTSDGLQPEAVAILLRHFPMPQPTAPSNTTSAMTLRQPGEMTKPDPTMPTELDLSFWGVSGDEHFDDPVALAEKAIAALDQIDTALDTHLTTLEQRRDTTKSAAQRLRDKREGLKTKAIKAELRAEFINHEIKQDEATLQREIEALGKKTANGENAA